MIYLPGDTHYTKAGDGGITGITGINPEAVAKVSAVASTLPREEDKYLLWTRVLGVIENAFGIMRLSKDQQSLLYYEVTKSGTNWEKVYERVDYLHPRDMPGSSFAENSLGMTVDNCNLLKLYYEARKRSDARQVVINNLATKLILQCSRDENSSLSFLRQNGFTVQDGTSQYDQRADFGDRDPYEHVYFASLLTKKNWLLSYLKLPYDGYFAQLFVRDGRVDWVAAYVQRAHIN